MGDALSPIGLALDKEGIGWTRCAAAPILGGSLEQLFNVFQQQAFGLGAAVVDEDAASRARGREEEEDAVDVEMREELDDPRHDHAHAPVGHGRERHCLGSHAEGEDLWRIDPADGSPGDGKVEDEEGRADNDHVGRERGALGLLNVASAAQREEDS